MVELLVTALTLGLAGIDPAGLLLALGALAAGARERTVLAFAAVVVLGTALLGTVLTVAVGQHLQDVDWASLLPPDWLGATIEALLAGALLAWAAVRLRRPEARPPRPAGRGRTGSALLGAVSSSPRPRRWTLPSSASSSSPDVRSRCSPQGWPT